MRLGLLADIHEEVEYLAWAIDALRAERVDHFVLLGDLYETGKRLEPMIDLLEPLDASGVWGNHDYGLCRHVSDWVRQRFPARVREYFARLHPRVEIDGCLFQHIEPHLDADDVLDLWSYGSEGQLDSAASFAGLPFHRAFMGHVHRWELWTPEGQVDWKGDRSVILDPQRRYLVILHGVQQGHCAMFDTTSGELVPFTRP